MEFSMSNDNSSQNGAWWQTGKLPPVRHTGKTVEQNRADRDKSK